MAGNSLCVLPCFMADGEPRLRRVLGSAVSLIRSFWLIIHSDLLGLARVRAVSEFVTDQVRLERRMFLPQTLVDAPARENGRPG